MCHFFCIIFLLLCDLLFHSLCAHNNPSLVSFHQGFSKLYGEDNIILDDGNNSVKISMDETTSSGFHSKLMYIHGYFETSLKLPENYTAGVVVTFYTSNSHKYPYHHDEIDFEFLGHIHGQKWLLQTNFYGNGSTNRGREERYNLWFDPSEDFHRYGLLWSENRITYYVDDVPVRVVNRVDAMGGDFPAKEMNLYGTIWNGSGWATGGGKYQLDLSYGPFVAEYWRFVLNGSRMENLTREERTRMEMFRKKWMTYSYCYDRKRYVVPLPECVFNSEEFEHLQKFDPWVFSSG